MKTEHIVFDREQMLNWIASHKGHTPFESWRNLFRDVDDDGVRKVFVRFWLLSDPRVPMPVPHRAFRAAQKRYITARIGMAVKYSAPFPVGKWQDA